MQSPNLTTHLPSPSSCQPMVPLHPTTPNAESESLGLCDPSLQMQHVDGEEEQEQAFPVAEALPWLLLSIVWLSKCKAASAGSHYGPASAHSRSTALIVALHRWVLVTQQCSYCSIVCGEGYLWAQGPGHKCDC